MCYTMKDRKFNSPVLLDTSDLVKLRNDAESCVKVKTCLHQIILHPFHLSNVGISIKEILNAGIAKYHHEFEGILLGYENIKLIGYKAPMYDDKCYLHKKIEADFYIFNPTVDSILIGVINKKSEDHIGCLVHKIFNISLPRPAGAKDWLGSNAVIGQVVQFKVSFMNLDSRLPYIRGEVLALISSEDSGISTSDETALPKGKVSKFNLKSKQPKDNESMKKKKLTKKKTTGETDEVEPNVEFKSPTKKKKSKKEKKLKLEDDNDELDYSELFRGISDDEVSLEELEIKSPIKKKKSKKDKKSKNKDEITKSNQSVLLEGLEQQYEDELEVLKKMAQSDNENESGKQKKKKVKSNKVTEECIADDSQNDNSNKKAHKKDKKEKKKNKDKSSKKEKDLLDETLPDLNLDALFEDGSISGLNNSKNESMICENIVLPNDSEMDEVLKDIPKNHKKSKKSSKKRKLDEDVEGESITKKKKQKST